MSLDGDEWIVYDSARMSISAGVEQTAELTCDDVMVFNVSDAGIDVLLVHPAILNFEVIDLTNDADTGVAGVHSLTNLSLQDVLDMTDASNDLKIQGAAADSVSIIDNANWSASAPAMDADGHTYVTYTNTPDASMGLFIENTVAVSVI